MHGHAQVFMKRSANQSRRATAIGLVLLLALAASCRAAGAEKKIESNSAVPTARVIASEFETARGAWTIPADRSIASKTLNAPAGTAWDLRKVSALMVKAER